MADSATRAARRTRRPDVFTTAFLVLTTVFGAWTLGLFVLTLLAIAQPAFFYSDQKAAMIKALGATVVAVLALLHAQPVASTGLTRPSRQPR
jgi:hypothetical protein